MIENLHCIMPGLLTKAQFGGLIDYCPTAHNLLCKSQSIPDSSRSFEAALRYVFDGLSHHELPIGALRAKALGLSTTTDNSVWMCADLVCLKADAQTVYCDNLEACTLEDNEKASLVALMVEYFRDENIGCVSQGLGSWLLHMPRLPKLSTNTLQSVVGRSIYALLPSGEDQALWHRRLTECQMLLTQHPVNQKRMRESKPLANGIWFWGLGSMPSNVTTVYDRAVTSDPIVQGLCLLADKSCLTLDVGKTLGPQKSKEKVLYVDSGLELLSEQARLEYLLKLEEHLFKPLLRNVRAGILKTLSFDLCKGIRYSLCKRNLHYFWRRQL